MITCLSLLASEYKGGFFQLRSTDEVILGVGFFSIIGHISSVGYISNVGLRVVASWGELNS